MLGTGFCAGVKIDDSSRSNRDSKCMDQTKGTEAMVPRKTNQGGKGGKKQKGGGLSAKPQAPPSHRHSSRKVLVLRLDPNSPSKLLELTPAFVTAHDGAPQSTKRNNDNATSVRIRYRLAEQQFVIFHK